MAESVKIDFGKPLGQLDMDMLRKQKSVLMRKIVDASKADAAAMQGIVYILDSIQDYAVDNLGYPENMVFKGGK